MLPVLFGENLFDDFFDDSFERELRAMNRNPLYGKHGRNLMKTDVRENGDNYELAIDLPDPVPIDTLDRNGLLDAAGDLECGAFASIGGGKGFKHGDPPPFPCAPQWANASAQL